VKAYQIFQNLSPELARDAFHYLRTEQKEVYQSAVASLAGQRKLRPVFIQRKPPEQQYAWLAKTTKLKSTDEIDQHLLQLWLLKAHQQMLIEFLDGIGIEHDGEGGADDLPESLDAKKLAKTVDTLLDSNDPELVTAYLYTFQLQTETGWTEITDLIASDDRLGWAREEEEAEPKEAEPPKAEAKSEPAPESEPEPGKAEPAPESESDTEESVESVEDPATAGEDEKE